MTESAVSENRPIRVGVFSTHPIQYQVTLWRGLNDDPKLELEVFYFSNQGLSGSIDPGFGEAVAWDVPLLEGYKSTFLSREPIDQANRFAIDAVRQLLVEKQFDVVVLHGYTHRFARQLARLKRRYGYKIVLRGEFTEMPRRSPGPRSFAKRIYLLWFYRYVDHFCPIGVDAMEHLVKHGVPESGMTLSPYSVDDELIGRSMQKYGRACSREELGIPQDHLVFLFSGKMIPRKQPLMFAHACLDLAASYRNFWVIFLGSGDQYSELCALLEQGMPGRFVAPGFVNQSELGRYFTASDIFVLPSTYDTWGLVVNEAMHYGLPCIVSNMVGARRDLVVPGETGDIFDYDSIDSLKSSLEKILEEPASAVRMRENTAAVIGNYTTSKTLEGLKAAIFSVAEA